MTGTEIATSLVLGVDPTVPRLGRARAGVTEVRSALERALLPALRRPPCLVAFSGGLDSSGVLAAAVTAARRHGLPLPIPATNRFPDVPELDETSWQEAVVGHLKLDDWVRVEIGDELDLIGPVAAPGLLAHGVLWPPNAHFLLPLARQAAGGTLLTGVGGDELFTPASPRVVWVLARRLAPRLADARELAGLIAPPFVRRRGQRTRFDPPEWLRPAGRELWRDAMALTVSRAPFWWGPSVVGDYWPARSRLGVVESIRALAGDTVVEHPFLDPGFVAALAGSHWRTGFPSRSVALEYVFGDTVPRSVRERADKASFFRPFFNRHSRAFAETWDGAGVDPSLVDAEILREAWNQRDVDARSYAALQSAWLASVRVSA